MPAQQPAESLPFFVDTRLLHETLRVDPKRLDQWFAELRGRKSLAPREVVWAICALLGHQTMLDAGTAVLPWVIPPVPVGLANPRALLARLHAAVAARLAQLQVRTHAYGVALVVNSDQARVSWHLQRDLQAVLGWLDQGVSWARTPLGHHLTGHADPRAEATLWGRWRRVDLTDSQTRK